jgi:hypothetical protein
VPIEDLSIQDQKEAYRHIEEMSQRFLRLILATLALGFVFARPSWVNYMTGASAPSPGLRATRESGAFIGKLSPTIVLNNGNILKSLVVLSLISLLIAILLAGLVVFLIEPTEAFQEQQATALAYFLLRRKSKKLLRRAYISAFIGVLFLLLAASGFWAFYEAGGVNVLLFDVAVVVVGLVGMPVFILKILSGLNNQAIQNIDSSERAVELSVYCMGGVVAIIFGRYVWYNAINGLVVWGVATGVL